MYSAVATTSEIDNIAFAVRQLSDDIRNKVTLCANSCGILYYDFDMEGNALAGGLQEELGFPVIGCSTLAVMEGEDGYHEMSATLTVLTADDCVFSAILSEPLTTLSAKEETVRAYNSARAALEADPKLVIALCPNDNNITFDRCLDDLSAAAGHVPIIGGLPSCSVDGSRTVAFGYTLATNQAVFLLIGGNLKPLCALANVVSRFSDKSGVITRSDHEIIHEVDGVPFTEFIQSYGLNITTGSDIATLSFFQKYPLLVENREDDNDGVPYVRMISHIGEQGSGVGFAKTPTDSTISLAVLQREHINISAENGLRSLLEKIESGGEDYTYRTILCVSCAGRHLIMTPYCSAEAAALQRMLPPGISFSGFYAFGEICPTSMRDGVARNRLHNASIVFCAF